MQYLWFLSVEKIYLCVVIVLSVLPIITTQIASRAKHYAIVFSKTLKPPVIITTFFCNYDLAFYLNGLNLGLIFLMLSKKYIIIKD